MYTPELIADFAAKMQGEYPAFNKAGFISEVLDDSWEARELKDRYRRIAEVLGAYLPDYEEAIGILERLTGICRGFPYIFFPEFVAMFGLEHWDTSVRALHNFTSSNSSEFAVRPFIERDQERMLGTMLEWTRSPDEHVRRLASEGCRPRLPWGRPLRNLMADPSPVIPILAALRSDESEYVRRSVANNLNDISKDHPGLVLSLAGEWLGGSKETDRLLKHACRTLLKKGRPEALRLFGFGSEGSGLGVAVTGLEAEASVIRLGEELCFRFLLSSAEPAAFKLQYAIDFVKANGTTSEKRFHLPEKKNFSGTEAVTWALLFQDYTTRKHYPGTHRLSILVNGEEKASIPFELVIDGRQ